MMSGCKLNRKTRFGNIYISGKTNQSDVRCSSKKHNFISTISTNSWEKWRNITISIVNLENLILKKSDTDS